MLTSAAGLMTGFLFGLGLALARMTDPAVVLGFLDVAGRWNPNLLAVMAAGLAVTLIGYSLTAGLDTPLLGGTRPPPPPSAIDARLVGGAAIFGLGWGLAGYCPGPVIASLASGNMLVFAFVAAMVAGMIATRIALK